MLKLERMKISGFKSFGDKTEVSFRGGVTAVVGPNGCGKSNIGDAINWVLGEQSAKQLRGKQMADVIFNGSAGRKPVGLAEVSIHLSGAEGLEFADQGQLVVTRRLFRSGESDYQINGKRARLRDIQETLQKARVGARSYATIEQGRIEQILNAKPKDRRILIEDAAGIAGYKHKRRLTEMKLEATQANLLRVNDIVLEVERQIRALKRQAARARRYRRLRDELRQKEQVRFALRARDLDAQLARLRAAETAARDEESQTAARLGQLEVELIEQREGLDEVNRRFREGSERLHQLELEIERAETQVRSCKERIEESGASSRRQREESERLTVRREEALLQLEAQRSVVETGRQAIAALEQRLAREDESWEATENERRELEQEIEGLRRAHFEAMNGAADLRNRLRREEEELERNGAQRARLESELESSQDDWSRQRQEAGSLAEQRRQQHAGVESLRAAATEIESALRSARERQAAEIEEQAQAREREQSAAARKRTLEDVATRFAGVSDGVGTLLSQGGAAGVRTLGVVADFIEAGADVEHAAENYLDWFLPTVILEDDGDVERATELLRAAGAGRMSLISRAQPTGGLAVGTTRNGALPSVLQGDPRVRGRLRDRLSLRTNGVIQDRVGDAVLVDTIGAALDLHRQYPAADYLTPEGDVVYASGVISIGGRATGNHGLLAHKRHLQEATAEFATFAARGLALQQQVESSRAEIVRLEIALRGHRQELDEAAQRGVELEVQLRRSADETERTGRRREVLTAEMAGLVEQAERHREAIRDLVRQVAEAEERYASLEQTLKLRNEALDQLRANVQQRVEVRAGLRAERAGGAERQEALEQQARRLDEAAGELGSRIEQLLAGSQAEVERAREASELQSETERVLATQLEERKTLFQATAGMEHDIVERKRRLGEREGGLRHSREALEALRETTRKAELERTRAESDRQHLDELCRQELGSGVAEALQSLGPEQAAVDLAQLEAEVAGIKDGIEKIGPVNMTAIDEFRELEERHGFLTSQRADLDQSMASLQETIRRLNRSSREKFSVAFEAIRESYQEIFKSLFNGGRADLQLEEGEDVLDCGIEILVQPPGKRLGNISLMSGGEKSLSAIALLFAVFRYQPSPFCLLDEVDAALDDANVGRFTRMVGEYAKQTQFIIVTHNKLSMEAADLIYGVTMEEPGVSKVVSLQMH